MKQIPLAIAQGFVPWLPAYWCRYCLVRLIEPDFEKMSRQTEYIVLHFETELGV